MARGEDRFLLVHGTATTAGVWAGVGAALRAQAPGRPVTAPDRPSTGALSSELAALRGYAAPGTVLGGVSGGATLGLAMLAARFPLAAAVLHEPAVGSLLPGLLAPVAAAHAEGGVSALGRRLYGPAWTPADAPADPDAVARDLTMFLGFEPERLPSGGPDVVVTVGERSPAIRHRAAAALERELGVEVRVLPGCGHAVHLEQPALFAAVLVEVAARPGRAAV
jgi:pimeloyl-ACP methyl ester carboxylesterase